MDRSVPGPGEVPSLRLTQSCNVTTVPSTSASAPPRYGPKWRPTAGPRARSTCWRNSARPAGRRPSEREARTRFAAGSRRSATPGRTLQIVVSPFESESSRGLVTGAFAWLRASGEPSAGRPEWTSGSSPYQWSSAAAFARDCGSLRATGRALAARPSGACRRRRFGNDAHRWGYVRTAGAPAR
jgi:hypothetical protein